MKIVLYTDEYRSELESLLVAMSSELYGKEAGTADVDRFVSGHWCIYLAISNNVVVGLSSFSLNTWFGLRDTTLANNFIYIVPEYRASKAMYLFSIQAGKICIDNNLPLEHYYASEGSTKCSSRLVGKKMFDAYIYEVGEVSKTFNKLISKVRIK